MKTTENNKLMRIRNQLKGTDVLTFQLISYAHQRQSGKYQLSVVGRVYGKDMF